MIGAFFLVDVLFVSVDAGERYHPLIRQMPDDMWGEHFPPTEFLKLIRRYSLNCPVAAEKGRYGTIRRRSYDYRLHSFTTDAIENTEKRVHEW